MTCKTLQRTPLWHNLLYSKLFTFETGKTNSKGRIWTREGFKS